MTLTTTSPAIPSAIPTAIPTAAVVPVAGDSRRKTTRRAMPEVAVLVSTYEKPQHLRRVLVSLALQEGMDDALEVVVSDDGSSDQTQQVVERFREEVGFPIHFTTHPHDGFQLARCRNEGVAASRAPYLLFLDGDCVVPRDHLLQHLAHRSEGWVMGGYCCRLDETTSARLTETAIREDAYQSWVPRTELKKLAKRYRKARFYNWIRHPGKPKLAGGNIAVWRDDYERINGYDENFVGWGGEDDDLRRRLAATGLRVGSILRWTRTYHLWHPPAPTAVTRFRDGVNVDYALRPGRLTRCRNGLAKRSLADIAIGLRGIDQLHESSRSWFRRHFPQTEPSASLSPSPAEPCEVEILFHPTRASFSGCADCNLLIDLGVGLPRRRLPRRLLKQAHLLVAPRAHAGFQTGMTHFLPHQTETLLAAIC